MTDVGLDRSVSQSFALVTMGQGSGGRATDGWQDKRRGWRTAKPLLRHTFQACHRSVAVPRRREKKRTTTSCAAPSRFVSMLTSR
jgi:hypothetical protein